MSLLHVCLVVLLASAALARHEFGQVVSKEEIISPITGGGITIARNELGVPYVTAADELDLFYGQGLVVATDRLWQIEFWRRFIGGTLSEVFGPTTLPIDISSRRMQWREVCEKNIANTPSNFIANVEAYALGVNAFIEMCRSNSTLLPPEYAQYDAPFPEPFQVIDTFFVLKGLSLGLANNAGSEIANKQQQETVGEERFLGLNSFDPQQPDILPPYAHSSYDKGGASAGRADELDLAEDLEMQREIDQVYEQLEQVDFDAIGLLLPSYYKAKEVVAQTTRFHTKHSSLQSTLTLLKMAELTYASNNWVVSGNFTSTGKPILSSDPHLPYFAPSIWYLIGLNCTNPKSSFRHVFGVTVIGAPGIGIGRNERLVWGYTTNKADSQDFFEMQNNADNTAYFYKNEWVPYVVTQQNINVKGVGNVTETFTNSVYGPVSIDGDDYYSLHWAVLFDTDTSLQGMYMTNIASTWDEWYAAASLWWGLLFNAAYADVDGNIAMQISGKIPLRHPDSRGLVPMPGNGTYDWPGLIPFDDLPSSFNPTNGFLVSANNRPGTEKQLKHPMPGEYAPGFRAQRIIDLIMDEMSKGNKIDVSFNERVQGDVLSLEFSYLFPALSRLQLSSQPAEQRHSQLLAWNGDETTSSKEASTFENWVYCLWNVTSLTLDGAAIENPWLTAQWFNNASISGQGDDPICAPWGVTCLEYASQCFEQAVAETPSRRYGLDHLGVFIHLPPVPVQWNRVVPVGGDHYTPNACTFTIHIPGVTQALVVGGPSVRFVSDLSGATPSQWVLPIGESGDPRSEHYDDQLNEWTKDKYYSMGWEVYEG